MAQNKTVKVYVIILNYNGAPYVKRCLGSLLKNAYPNFEVLFIDNNSPDRSADLAEQLFGSDPRLKIIKNTENYGFSMGNNIGLERATSGHVIVLNNDTEVDANFIGTLSRVAESDEKIGSVGCKIVQTDGSVRYGPVYMSYGFIVNASERKTYDKFTVNLANCGCATLFKKAVLDKIGGFETLFWADWEDHDLGYRVNLAGYRSVYTPETTVLHLGGGLSIGMSKERKVRIFRNRLLTYLKNYETRNVVLRLPLIVLVSIMKEMLLTIKKKEPFPLFKGVGGFFMLFKQVLAKRRLIQRNRVASDREIMRNANMPEYRTVLDTLKHL